MKPIPSTFSLIGVASGLLFALGPWILGVRDPTLANYLMPVIVGAGLVAIHWLSFRRIRAGSGDRLALMIANGVLFVVILFGLVSVLSPANHGPSPGFRIAVLAIFLLPLVSNLLYL